MLSSLLDRETSTGCIIVGIYLDPGYIDTPTLEVPNPLRQLPQIKYLLEDGIGQVTEHYGSYISLKKIEKEQENV